MAGLSKSKVVLYKGFHRTEHAVAELKKKEQGLTTESEIRQKELGKKREIKEEEKQERKRAIATGAETDAERLMKEGDIEIAEFKKEKAKKQETIQLQSPEEQARIQQVNSREETAGTIIGNILEKVGGAFEAIDTLGGLLPAAGEGYRKNLIEGTVPLSPVGGSGKGFKAFADVDKIGKQLGLSAKQTAALAKNIGNQRISNLAKDVLKNPLFLKTGRVAINSKTGVLKSSYLMKLAATASNPVAVLGLLGTTLFTSLFWAPNEKGDALTLLTIAQRDAVKAGEPELALKIGELIEETADIAANIPVIGFIQAELAKFEAARIASKASTAAANKLLEEQAKAASGEPSEFEASRIASDIAARERQLAQRSEDTAFFEEQQRTTRKRQLQQREEDTEFFEKQSEENRERELKEREEDTDFFDKVADENRKRKLDERAADSEFFDNLKRERTGQPLTDGEKQTISDWNAGKSSLNFKWLGR